MILSENLAQTQAVSLDTETKSNLDFHPNPHT